MNFHKSRHSSVSILPRAASRLIRTATASPVLLIVVITALTTSTARAQELMPTSPTGWSTFSARPETAPGVLSSTGGTGYILEIFGNNVPNVYGGWRTAIQGLQGGRYYRFRARALPTSIASPRESITILLRWRGAFGDEVAPDYVWNYTVQSDDSLVFDSVIQTPLGTTRVDVELVLQWAPAGRIRFDALSFAPSAGPATRPVKVAAVYFRPSGTSSGLESVQQAASHGDGVAAAHSPDVMVFGELLNVIGAPGTFDTKAESVPGPSTNVMAGLARSHGTYVVFGVLERVGSILYNTAVLLDRSGNIAGKHRKVQLPLADASSGLMPGDGVSVFETDFGRVALLICQDTAFSEPPREAAIKGAEMLLVPIWGGKQATVRARAIDHSMYVVASGYDYASEVIDPLGRVLDAVDNLDQPGVAVATLDLSQRFREYWIGDWRDTTNKERLTTPYTADPTTPPGGGGPPPPPPDTTAPIVSLTAPASDATVSGIVTVTATASDNVGVTAVRFSLDGAALGGDDVLAPYSISWDSKAVTNGAHALTATAYDSAGNSAASSTTITVANATTPPGSTPFTGTPVSLPGRIEAENFDNGGANVAYFDTTAGNRGGVYRDTDVDLEPASETGGGYNLAKIRAGEWLNYSVTTQTAGAYMLHVRVASAGVGGRFHVESNGVDVSGPLTVPDTGGWQAWTTIHAPVTLRAGQQILRLVFDAESAIGIGNVNWLEVAAPPTGSTPFAGMPVSLPARIEAENFDHGGINVAYYDTTAGNKGSVYRDTDVDLEPTSDVGGGYNLAKIRAGEWLNYTVNVGAEGYYTLRVRVASSGVGGRFHVETDDGDVSGPLSVPDTGGWQIWTTISVPVHLRAGQQILKLVVDAESPTNVFGNVNWLEIVSGS